jgi:hypothetical protein
LGLCSPDMEGKQPYIGRGLPFCGKPHYSHLLISVTSQVLSGKQNKNALDPLAEVGSKVPKIPSQEMCSTSFDGSQWDRYVLLWQRDPFRKFVLTRIEGPNLSGQPH